MQLHAVVIINYELVVLMSYHDFKNMNLICSIISIMVMDNEHSTKRFILYSTIICSLENIGSNIAI